jgi:hypothetical protein
LFNKKISIVTTTENKIDNTAENIPYTIWAVGYSLWDIICKYSSNITGGRKNLPKYPNIEKNTKKNIINSGE